MSIWLYTFYGDIPPADADSVGTPQFVAAQKKAARRDRVIRVWLQLNEIGAFPKPESEVVALLPKFGAYSESNPELYFMFSDGNDRFRVLHRGALTSYADYDAAVRGIYSVPEETDIATHRNIVFPKYSDGSANPGVPPTDAP
jgi:hypothetical protein